MIFVVAELYRNTNMNPQPSPLIGVFMSMVAVLIIAYHALKMHNSLRFSDRSINYDLFNLGVIERDPTLVQNFVISPSNSDLYHDCVNALVGLGYKKKQAHKKAQSVFNSNPPSSIIEFLNTVTKK
jgi:hypothetical protein